MLFCHYSLFKAELVSESKYWCSSKQELIQNQGDSGRASTLLRGGMSQRRTAEDRHLYLHARNQDSLQILTLDAITEKIMFFRPSILSFIPSETVDNALGFPQIKI